MNDADLEANKKKETITKSWDGSVNNTLRYSWENRSLKEFLLIFGVVYILVEALTFVYLLIPLHEPGVGIQNNWGFLIAAFINLNFVICVETLWGYFYTGYLWWSPLLGGTTFTMIGITLYTEWNKPFKLFAFAGAAVLSISFPVIFTIRERIAGKSKDEQFQSRKKPFFVVRILTAFVILLSWSYLVLFLVFPNLQEFFSVLYGSLVFVAKYTMVFINHNTLTTEFHGMGGFFIELFHSMFILYAFPSINGWLSISFVVGVQICSSAMIFVTLSDIWWKVITRLRLTTNKVSPSSLPVPTNAFQLAPNNVCSPIQTKTSSSTTSQDTTTFSPRKTSELSVSQTITLDDKFTPTPTLTSPLSTSSTQLIDGVHYHSQEEFQKGMIRVTSFTLIAQFIAPFYYIPVAFFIRLSYNADFFPYKTLNSTSFEQTLVFSLFSSTLSLISLMVLFHVSKKRFNLNIFTQVLFPIINKQKIFVASVALSCMGGAIVTIQKHYQLYWAFV